MKDWNVIVLGEFISLIYSTFYNISLTEASQIYRMDDEIYTNPLLPGETDKSPLNGRKENNQVEDTYSTVKDDPSRLQESESNMEFTMVHSPEVRDECIYAVVSKGSKRNSSNLSSEKVDYSKIGLNDSIRKKPTSNNSQHFGNDSQYLMQDVYSSLDDISLHQTIEQDKHTKDLYEAISESSSDIPGISGVPIDGICHRYKFPAVFLGSMVVDLEKLEKNKNEYLLNCIQSVAAQNSEATTMTLKRFSRVNNLGSNNGCDVTLSTHRGMNVIIVLEGGHMKVKEKKTNSIRLDIPITSIRMWATGKGSSSREFAIISKDSSLKTELCRVFLCEVVARTVANIFKEICNQMLKLGETASQRSSTQIQRSNGSDNLKKTASVASINNCATLRSIKSEGSQPSNISLRDLTKCHYLGMMEVDKPTGTKVVERAIDMVHSYVSSEFWQIGKLLTTPDGLFFINDGNLGLSCPNSSLTFIGPSLKYKNLVGIIVRKNNGIFAHIFSMEEDALNWFENMKFICKLHSSKFDKSVSSTLNKRSKHKKS